MKLPVSDISWIIDALPFAVFAKDSQHRWIYGNKAFGELVGRENFVGLDDSAIFEAAQVEVFWTEDKKVFAGEESLNEEQIGENKFALTKKVPLDFPDGTTGLLGIIIDSVEIKSQDAAAPSGTPSLLQYADSRASALQDRLHIALQEKELAMRIAQTDAATGLRNRFGFEADVAEQIEKYETHGEPFSVALVDLDHFKRINDRFGHAAGDTVLKVVGKRLKKLPGVVSVARMGGDEFAIIRERLPRIDVPYLRETTEQARQFVFRPIFSKGREIQLSGSVGVCIYPRDASEKSDLMHCADLALFTAKRKGRASSEIFDSQIRQHADRRRRIEEMIGPAVAEGLIRPVYQPILCSKSRRAIGVEVLSRWEDEELGVIGPDEFVAVAAEIGFISRLDAMVLDTSLREAGPWLKQGLIDFVSLNISPADIVTKGFATDLITRVKATGVDPSQISLEILESSIVEDIDSAGRNLNRLREAGMKIALDDYGTGFSNLRALLDLPLDKLKIDKSLITGIDESDRMLDLVISIVQFARALDLAIVAEGVETDTQSAFVEGAGCPQMQGYFIARPMPREAAEAWLNSQTETSRKADAA